MGFFLIFFPGEEDTIPNKNTIFSSPSSSTSSYLPISLYKQTNSPHLLTKPQSILSICALLVLFSLLIFTVSKLEPNSNLITTYPKKQPSLAQFNRPKKARFAHALQGMGTLYRRGTRGMNDLIICHVIESVGVNELGFFIRLFYRSSLSSKSDLLFIFGSGESVKFDSVVRRETDSFDSFLTRFDGSSGGDLEVSFDPTPFVNMMGKKEGRGRDSEGTILWGKRRKSFENFKNGTELTRLSYGSVVGFEVDELDPENSLAGFLEHVPMELRRWACYTMLLGRTRRNFKHVMLVDVKEVLLLGDPLGRVRNWSPESVCLMNSDKTQLVGKSKTPVVTTSIIMGGARGVRRLANVMVMEIVRTTMQHKKKRTVSESDILSRLVENDFFLKSIKLVVSTESIPDVSSVNTVGLWSKSNYTMVRGAHGNLHFHADFMRHVCSFPLDSSVYSDC